MTLLTEWLRVDLRRHWRSLLLLALLIALASGTVLAAGAGARRGASAVDRLNAVTLPATAVVTPQLDLADWTRVRNLPQVEALSTFPGYNGFGIDEAPGQTVQLYIPADAEAMHTVERPVVLDGRLADPASSDEAVVTANFVQTHGLGVGNTVTLRWFSAEQVETGVSGVRIATPPRPDGPAVRTRIVGVVRSPWFGDAVGEPGRLFPSFGMARRYAANALTTNGIKALVRLRGGQDDLERFGAELARLVTPAPEVENRAEADEHLRAVTRFEAASLLAFALVALLAASVLVGQAIARYSAMTAADSQVLHALGMSRRQGLALACATPFLAAVIGTSMGVAAAIVASRWLPYGAAALIEPAPGPDADWLVLATGWVLTPALVLAVAIVAAWVSLATGAQPSVPSRRSTVARVAARTGLPVPALVGTRFALETGRGVSAVPVRPALVGAVTGVLGVVAAFTFAAGVADAAANPDRFGQTHQLTVAFGYSGQNYEPVQEELRALASDQDVTSIGDYPYAVASDGGNPVLSFGRAPGASPPIVLTEGRAPAGADEVVLGPAAARRLGVQIGDSVPFTGSARTATLRVVGVGFVPQTDLGNYDGGAWLASSGYDRIFAGFFLNHAGFVELRAGADPRAVIPRLTRAAQAVGGGQYLFPDLARLPSQLAEIQSVRVLPVVLGGFLTVLAVGAVGHALATAVRRRRRDVAVLRALGMTRRQSRGVVVTQASVLALVGLLLGIPLGLALGRTLWRLVSDTTPLQYVPPVAFWALVLIAPMALLIANLLAAIPGRLAARLPVNQILRAE